MPPGFPCIEKAEEVQDSHTSFGSFSGSPGLTPRTIDSDELQRTIDQQEPGLDANDLMPAPAKSLRPPPGLSRSGDEQCPITSTVRSVVRGWPARTKLCNSSGSKLFHLQLRLLPSSRLSTLVFHFPSLALNLGFPLPLHFKSSSFQTLGFEPGSNTSSIS